MTLCKKGNNSLMPTHSELSQKPFITPGRAIRVAALAVALRAGIVGLHHLEQIDYRQYGNLNFFALPIFEVIALLIVIVPSFLTLKRDTRFRDVGITVLMAVIINAALQIVDLVRTNGICNSEEFYKFEGFCELIVVQSFCNIPFVIIGLLVLLIWWPGSY